MKIALILSLILNVVLGYMAMKKPEKEIIERVIIEAHKNKPEEDRPSEVQTAPEVAVTKVSPDKKSKKNNSPRLSHFPEQEYQEAGDQMENDRHQFFTEKLGISEEKITEHTRIRDEYFKKMSDFWNKSSFKEPSFKERRDMINMEEELHKKLEKLHGKKNWERYQKFRDNYNQKGFKKQDQENQPFIFMNL